MADPKGSIRAIFSFFDFFGRSSSPSNHELTKLFALNLYKNGLLKIVEERQLYSKEGQKDFSQTDM